MPVSVRDMKLGLLAFNDPKALKALEGSGLADDIRSGKFGGGGFGGGAGSEVSLSSADPSSGGKKFDQSFDPILNISSLYAQDVFAAGAPERTFALTADGGDSDKKDMPDMSGGSEQEIKKLAKKAEKVFRKALKKAGGKQGGKGQSGRGFFSAISRAAKSVKSAAGQAVSKAIVAATGLKKGDSAATAFLKGLKSPLTIAKKLENLTGLNLGELSKKVGPIIAAAGAASAQPEIVALGGAITAFGPEAQRVIDGAASVGVRGEGHRGRGRSVIEDRIAKSALGKKGPSSKIQNTNVNVSVPPESRHRNIPRLGSEHDALSGHT